MKAKGEIMITELIVGTVGINLNKYIPTSFSTVTTWHLTQCYC